MNQSPRTYQRGELWMVDFGQPLRREQGLERPAVIVSKQELANTANIHGLLIVVPGTRTAQINPKTGKTRITCVMVESSSSNGLKGTTYFTAEKLRSVSTARLRRCLGRLEQKHLHDLENCLCLVMDLFR
jgi:mRNA interferase MazF